jgi:ATPase subunit of ABC transporter with duplicated ATPase domains
LSQKNFKLTHISKSFDDIIVFKDLNLKVNKGDKIGIIGPNGVGKTTLCKLIVNDNLKPDNGEIKWGQTVQYSYFPQDTTDRIKGNETLYDWLRSFDKKADISEIRNCLGRMLFNGEEQEKSVSKTSGGEKHRMMLSKIMFEGGNFLILDEPTNHLDLEAIVALGEGLYNYEGNVICVTHDRELLDAFANRIIEIKESGEFIDFLGTYEEYIQKNK